MNSGQKPKGKGPVLDPRALANKNPTVSQSEMALEALDSLDLNLDIGTEALKTQFPEENALVPSPESKTAVLLGDLEPENEGLSQDALKVSLLDEMQKGDETFSSVRVSEEIKSNAGVQSNQDNALDLASGEGAFDEIGENTLATIVGALDESSILKKEATRLASPDSALPQAPSVEAADFNLNLEEPRVDFDPQMQAEASANAEEATRVGTLNAEIDPTFVKPEATSQKRESRGHSLLGTASKSGQKMGALHPQIEELSLELENSEKERRSLQLKCDEMHATLKSLEDLRDKQQHLVRKLEMQHAEDLKALNARLENAQYQAQKAERKFEEFRERVKVDLLKIRSRERDLGSKLELQKRDAEALLMAKDERLLAQKRDIDRLEFEIQNLKERMLEETERAEERAAKLTRALQSLRMAQGMLSGIDEEVLPGSKPPGAGGGQGGQAA